MDSVKSSASILVVDDEPGLRQTIAFDFKRKGFRVFVAENGVRALEIVKSQKIDVILSDITMPGGDGVDLLNCVRVRDPRIPPVILMTGYSDFSLEEAYDRGAEAVFTKPFDRKALYAAVLRAVASKEDRWSIPRIGCRNQDVVVQLASGVGGSVNTSSGKALNLGRGGIFLATESDPPEVGTSVGLQIRVDSLRNISGTGIVRWARRSGSLDLPKGCGIEFEYFDQRSRALVIDLINSLKTGSFIPAR